MFSIPFHLKETPPMIYFLGLTLFYGLWVLGPGYRERVCDEKN